MIRKAGEQSWDRLDPSNTPAVDWVLPIDGRRCTVLLGAFDPPTNAHIAVVKAAGRFVGAPPALGMTKTLLDRPSGDELFSETERVSLLTEIAASEGLGLILANRGTYLEVARALKGAGFDASFVIGSDKLAQLADPVFYPDGIDGVRATFAEVGLIVVPRPGSKIARSDVTVIDPGEVFGAEDGGGVLARVSGSEVRRRVRAEEPVDGLVPRAVQVALGGYTSAR